MEEELVKRLDKFYGFIAPDGEKISVGYKDSKTHEDLAKTILLERYKESTTDKSAKDILLSRGYIAVSAKNKYISYSILNRITREIIEEYKNKPLWKMDEITNGGVWAFHGGFGYSDDERW